jgi:hypothetical protein
MKCMHDSIGYEKYFNSDIKCNQCGVRLKTNLNDLKIIEIFLAAIINIIVYALGVGVYKISYYDASFFGLPFIVTLHIIIVNIFLKFYE